MSIRVISTSSDQAARRNHHSVKSEVQEDTNIINRQLLLLVSGDTSCFCHNLIIRLNCLFVVGRGVRLILLESFSVDTEA